MKLQALLKTTAVAGTFALLTACANAPTGDSSKGSSSAISEAKAAVAKAKASGQPLWAVKNPAVWGIKTTQKVSLYSTENILIDAEAAAKNGDEVQAEKLAKLAKWQAEQILAQAQYGKNAGPHN
ncbi:MAG: hypothetical protein K6346_05955 [Halothiobacillaceae bacterium]